MSLVTLTFGCDTSKNQYFDRKSSASMRPLNAMRHKNGSLKIKKITEFFNVQDVYVIAEVTDGMVADTMKGCLNGYEFKVRDLESKVGSIGKKGATIGAYLQGLTKEDVEVGQEITVEVPGTEGIPQPAPQIIEG